MKPLLIIFGALIMAFSNTACAQGTEKEIVKLDEALLSRATSATYAFDNGTVAPDWRYDCWVTVYKDSVRLSVIAGYGKVEKYDSIVPLMDGQFEQFIARLANHSITKVPVREPIPVGGSIRKFWVHGTDATLFGGEEYSLEVKNGSLFWTFFSVLPSDLQDIMKAPEQLFEP